MTARSGGHGRVRLALSAVLALSLSACESTGVGKSGETKAKELSEQEKTAESDRLVHDLTRAIDEARLSDAQAIAQRLQNLNVAESETSLAAAEIELAQARYEPAFAAFLKLLPKPEIAARAHQGLGLALLLMRRPEDATTHLEAAVELDDKLWRAWNGLGYYFDLVKEWERADASYGKALALNPKSAKLVNNVGFSRLMRARYDDAIAEFHRALRLDPELKAARTNLRIALAWQGRYAEALAAVGPQDLPQALNNVGYVAMLRGDYVAAEAYFNRALEANPAYDAQAAANLRRLEALKSSAARGNR